MDKAKRKRAAYLALSGVCAVGAVLWIFIFGYTVDVIDWILYDILGVSIHFSGIGLFMMFYPNPFNLFAWLAVFLFIKGFVPAKRTALKITIAASSAVLLAYIAVVAFVKVDFISNLPIQIACGITPAFIAFCLMLFYEGKKWRKVLCAILASLALCASTHTLFIGGSFNNRQIVGYSKSPQDSRKVVVVSTINGGPFGRDAWESYVACPAWGLWYKQNNAKYVDPDVLDHIIWLDENTAQFSNKYGYEQTITFK